MERPHLGFPPWLQQLTGFGVLFASIMVGFSNIKSDQRSTREEVTRLINDVSAIRQALPNKEVYDFKFREIDNRLSAMEQQMNVKSMMDQKLREDLLKKDVID